MSCFETASGIRVDLDAFSVNMVAEGDIAQSLSMQCRYNGHTLGFYSVAEHCCLMSDWVYTRTSNPDHALSALMHDASEAYLSDLPAPVKALLPEYKVLEEHVEHVIARRFSLSYPWSTLIKDADKRILVDERRALFRASGHRWDSDDLAPLGITVHRWEPAVAKAAFLTRFYVLREARSNA